MVYVLCFNVHACMGSGEYKNDIFALRMTFFTSIESCSMEDLLIHRFDKLLGITE